jgi:hypothetical protein
MLRMVNCSQSLCGSELLYISFRIIDRLTFSVSILSSHELPKKTDAYGNPLGPGAANQDARMQGRQILERHIKEEQAAQANSTTILVTNLPESCTEDTVLMYYFCFFCNFYDGGGTNISLCVAVNSFLPMARSNRRCFRLLNAVHL